MELPLGRHFKGDRSEPCDLIVRASLGIDEHSSPQTDGWETRSILSYTGILCYPIDVQYEVTKGNGYLNFFDQYGNYVSHQTLAPGSKGTLFAGKKYEYIANDGLMTVRESDHGDDEDIVYGDV